jgi:alkylated DNA nucleotide flippase Atl1
LAVPLDPSHATPPVAELVEAPGRTSATDAGDDFVSRVLGVVESIPDGRVMTYGDVAATIGSRAARAVGHVMALYGDGVPWWRVIRSSGLPPVCHEDQALEHYEAEDTPLVRTASGYRIDLRTGRHRP